MAEPILVTLRFFSMPPPSPPQEVRISYTLKPDAVLSIDPTQVAKLPYTIFAGKTNRFGLRVEAFQAGQPVKGVELNILGKTIKTEANGLSPPAIISYGTEAEASVKLPIQAQSIYAELVRKTGIDLSIKSATAPPPIVVANVKLYSSGSASFKVVMLEGDYSTWTQKWEATLPFTPNEVHEEFFYEGTWVYAFYPTIQVAISGNRVFISAVDSSTFPNLRTVILSLEDGSLIEHLYTPSPSTSGIGIGIFGFTTLGRTSILGKYVLISDRWNDKLMVYKNGQKVWETDYSSIGFISPDGKYIIAISGKSVALFEGS